MIKFLRKKKKGKVSVPIAPMTVVREERTQACSHKTTVNMRVSKANEVMQTYFNCVRKAPTTCVVRVENSSAKSTSLSKYFADITGLKPSAISLRTPRVSKQSHRFYPV